MRTRTTGFSHISPMIRQRFLITVLLAFGAMQPFSASAQPKRVPVIKADSVMVDITENGVTTLGAWTIVPEAKPDVYITNQRGARITFRTNRDSITVVADSGKVVDFIILLGKQKAWTRVEYKPTFLDVLRKADRFNPSDPRPTPAFSYQSADAAPLLELRKAFNLDSIAGQGNEVSRMLEVMHWLHDLVPHDGQHDNPVVKNALSMIAECKREKRGLNCRGLATVLNECYLALGFKSRFITCLPQDTADFDCHVINMVWSNDLKKWLWLDPTHDSYVMDETGTMLGPWEVRERLINGRPIILNPDANWNHRQSSLREAYIESYMAKNLYRLECPVVSQYDTETPGADRTVEYVQLIPLDYHTQTPDVETRKGKRTIITYRTNDPARFWAAP